MYFATETTIPWLNRALDMSYHRHTVLSGNIANADTPEYAPRDVQFTDYLEAELHGPGYFGPNPGLPEADIRGGVEATLNGNTVDVEKEMVEMTSNRMFYELATEIVTRTISGLQYAIDEGGR